MPPSFPTKFSESGRPRLITWHLPNTPLRRSPGMVAAQSPLTNPHLPRGPPPSRGLVGGGVRLWPARNMTCIPCPRGLRVPLVVSDLRHFTPWTGCPILSNHPDPLHGTVPLRSSDPPERRRRAPAPWGSTRPPTPRRAVRVPRTRPSPPCRTPASPSPRATPSGSSLSFASRNGPGGLGGWARRTRRHGLDGGFA